MTWKDFYKIIDLAGYDVVRNSNVFRGDKFILNFDPQEDEDSGEIEKVLEKITLLDPFNSTKTIIISYFFSKNKE